MKTNKLSIIKIVTCVVFAILVFGVFFYRIFGTLPADFALKIQHLDFICVGLCFLFALLFVRLDLKKILIALMLALCVAADYFLIYDPKEEYRLIGLCILSGAQAVLLVYTLALNKGNGRRVINIASRVAICLVAYFVLPEYFTLDLLQIIYMMNLLNFFVSLIVVLINIKKEWLLFLGLLLLILCDVVVGLKNGGLDLFGITGPFADFLNSYELEFYLFIPGLFLTAHSSAFSKKKQS